MDRPSDRIIENTFAKRLRSGARVNQEFKATQITSGASGVLSYTAANPVDWDRIETLPYSDPAIGGINVELTITFTGDGTQLNPFAIPFTDLRINGTGDSNKLVFIDGNWWWNYGAWSGPMVGGGIYDAPVASSFSDVNRLKWTIFFYYVGNVTYNLKLRARSTCAGTLTVTRTI